MLSGSKDLVWQIVYHTLITYQNVAHSNVVLLGRPYVRVPIHQPAVFIHKYWIPSSQLKARGEPVAETQSKHYFLEPGDRPLTNCTIFLGYTSNMISCGVRETLHYLVKNNMVSQREALQLHVGGDVPHSILIGMVSVYVHGVLAESCN